MPEHVRVIARAQAFAYAYLMWNTKIGFFFFTFFVFILLLGAKLDGWLQPAVLDNWFFVFSPFLVLAVFMCLLVSSASVRASAQGRSSDAITIMVMYLLGGAPFAISMALLVFKLEGWIDKPLLFVLLPLGPTVVLTCISLCRPLRV